MRRRRAANGSAAALLALFLMSASAAQAQYFGRNKIQYQTFSFKLLATEHFDVYYYEDERAMAEQAARMAERWYARLSRALGAELKGRQPLILYASHPDFEQTNAIPGELDESTGGVTESFKRRIVLPLTGSLAETDHVIGHELVHAFQYDLRRRGEGNPFDPATMPPLWFLEGMAEYLSIGPDDPLTAMWMRDAVRSGKLPKVAQLDHPKYFPYRYGQAFWAYVASRFGESSVGAVLRAASGRGVQAEPALASALGVAADTLSLDWHSALREWAARAGVTPGDPKGKKPAAAPVAARDTANTRAMGRLLIGAGGDEGRLNVGPSLSPDGERVAFLSERDRFSIELFLADARTGKVLRRLTRSTVDPHLQSLQFIHSAGEFSPDGKRIAIATVSKGTPALTLIDVQSGNTVERIPFPGLGEIFGPTWSPDGERVAFSAIAGGTSDLFVVELAGRSLTRLTQDLYADLQPAWSPDGRTLAFVTDRFSTDLAELEYGEPALAQMDVGTREIRAVPGGDAGRCLNPRWSRESDGLYFISDRSGIANVYRVTLASGAVTQLTDVVTGVSGITRMSPALAVARNADRVVFTLFENGTYQLRALENSPALAGSAPFTPRPLAGVLPGPHLDSSEVTATSPAALPEVASFRRAPYRASLSLDHASQAALGVSAGSGGVALGGGSAFYWSDMLGNHNLATMIQTNGVVGSIDKSLGAVVGYQNRRRRWNWGLEGYQIPSFQREVTYQEHTIGSTPVVTYRDRRVWQIERAIDGAVHYPVSRAQRLEFSAGYRSIDFLGEVRRQTFSLIDGRPIGNETIEPGPEDSIPTLDLFTTATALVFDNSVFGGTSPVAGHRYRLELAPVLGDLQLTGVLADYRRYHHLVGPLTVAGRGIHFGRYGRDSESDRISPLFLGYPWLVRGYDAESFVAGESLSPDDPFTRLFGSRLAVANLELRLPLLGALGVIRSPGVPPVEAATFFDAGAAWTRVNEARFLGGGRPGISSYGGAVRVNLFGFAVGEVAYVHPNDRPLKGWYWQFSLQPGF